MNTKVENTWLLSGMPVHHWMTVSQRFGHSEHVSTNAMTALFANVDWDTVLLLVERYVEG